MMITEAWIWLMAAAVLLAAFLVLTLRSARRRRNDFGEVSQSWVVQHRADTTSTYH